MLGLLFDVDRSTITRAIGEIRRLLADRGCAVPDRPGLRLRTLTDVIAYARGEGVEPRLDATEIPVRRPSANRGGRRAFVPGKKKQNTMKATVIADWRGRTLWTDALRPGRMHDGPGGASAQSTAWMTPRPGPWPPSSFCRTQPGGRRYPRVCCSIDGGSRVVGTSSYETPDTGFTWPGACTHTTYQARSTLP